LGNENENENENENDYKNPKVYPVSLYPSPFESNSGRLLQILLLSIYITRGQQAVLIIARPIQLYIGAKKDTGLRNISTKIIRLGKISKNTTGYPG
jgi:hypothetical protein